VLFASNAINANTIYGTLQNGVPVVSINFTALNNSINQNAQNNGYVNGSLISMEIVNESNYGYSFRYLYQFTEQSGQIIRLKTGIPLVLTGTNFEEETIVNGGRKTTTCSSKNCDPGGCELVKDDCLPPCPPKPDQVVECNKSQTDSGSPTTPVWIGTVIGILNFLKGIL
jgi:hypothetical protein